jgi:CPA2 family monovalent cation:H+ antiporter-2
MVKNAVALQAEPCVLARARNPTHAARLTALGAVGVIPEAIEASLQLGAQLLEQLDLPSDVVARRLDEARDEEVGRLGKPAA